MSRPHMYVIQYSDGTEDALHTSTVPFTLEDLKTGGRNQRYEYWDHIGNKMEVVVDKDVMYLLEVEGPPDPPQPTM